MESSSSNELTMRFTSAWYIWANLCVLMYSFTLVVHVCNAYTSLRLLSKLPKNFLIQLGSIHATSAIICHISKISDFFFVTNCQLKVILNPSCYYVSTTMLAAVLYRRCYFSLPCGRPLFFIGSIIIFGLKLSGSMLRLITITVVPGVFHECQSTTPPSSSSIFIGIEIAVNAYLIFWWLIILAFRVYRQSRSWQVAICKDGGAYTVTSAVSTIIFYSLLMNGIVFGLSTDVLFQLQWAIQSMLCTQQLVNYYHDIRVTLPMVHDTTSTTACGMLQDKQPSNFLQDDTVEAQQSSSKSCIKPDRDLDISI
ncbi:hypothetical protein K7432_002830 [Basidiobolus ranarum]|uniref:Vomeronasal type-1 receptor n=1 Tax=Basidiobolus ranarum TaxID=34480 RepID=A0ABR2W773_9FUNG